MTDEMRLLRLPSTKNMINDAQPEEQAPICPSANDATNMLELLPGAHTIQPAQDHKRASASQASAN